MEEEKERERADNPVYKDGFYIYSDGFMASESDVIENASVFDNWVEGQDK